jgi:D-glycero-D-manno-heptose 1,7-bisphosphate phosphatase
MNKAIFLDRDGVINKELGDYVKKLSDFEVLPHVVEGLKLFQENGFLLIVVTNQGGISKKEYTLSEMHDMHVYLNQCLAKAGIELTHIYYCPHHPNQSNCLCRKPESLLVEKAIAKYHIDPATSYFIGDKQRDIDCGMGAGVKGFLIEPNQNWVPIAKQICS